MKQSFFKQTFFSRKGLTLIEVLLVVSMIGMIGLAVSNALVNGMKVWERSQRSLIEEDVAIFFDKMRYDLHNAYLFSQFKFEGFEHKFSFPAVIEMMPDRNLRLDTEDRIPQMGKVEYSFDFMTHTIRRKQSNYSQSFRETFDKGQEIVRLIDKVKFRYYYITDEEEIFSSEILDVIPSGVEVEVEFSDKLGRRSLKKFIDIPVGS